jgi:hypothetical protein
VVVPVDTDTLIESSAVIVAGEVVSAQSYEAPGGGIFTAVGVDVSHDLHGANGAQHLTLTVHGGRVGDRAMVVHGQATFRPGERVTLFLVRARGSLWPNAMAQGKWSLVESADGAWWTFPTSGPNAGVAAWPLEALAQRIAERRRP